MPHRYESEGDQQLVELLRCAARHDEAAARAFIDALGPLVLRIIHSHVPLRREAEDVLQEVFFRLFRDAEAYRRAGPIDHWVARVAKCACIDRLRRLKVRQAEISWSDLTPQQQATLSEPVVEASITHGEDSLALLELLFSRLSPLDAWLLREVELHERPLAEVAAEAGWNATLTRVRLYRARRRLRTAFTTLTHLPS